MKNLLLLVSLFAWGARASFELVDPNGYTYEVQDYVGNQSFEEAVQSGDYYQAEYLKCNSDGCRRATNESRVTRVDAGTAQIEFRDEGGQWESLGSFTRENYENIRGSYLSFYIHALEAQAESNPDTDVQVEILDVNYRSMQLSDGQNVRVAEVGVRTVYTMDGSTFALTHVFALGKNVPFLALEFFLSE